MSFVLIWKNPELSVNVESMVDFTKTFSIGILFSLYTKDEIKLSESKKFIKRRSTEYFIFKLFPSARII